jgi:hypothetical protein
MNVSKTTVEPLPDCVRMGQVLNPSDSKLRIVFQQLKANQKYTSSVMDKPIPVYLEEILSKMQINPPKTHVWESSVLSMRPQVQQFTN